LSFTSRGSMDCGIGECIGLGDRFLTGGVTLCEQSPTAKKPPCAQTQEAGFPKWFFHVCVNLIDKILSWILRNWQRNSPNYSEFFLSRKMPV